MINEPHELSKRSFSAEVDHSFELRMLVPLLTNLHKLDLVPEMIDHCLVTIRSPSFYGNVAFAA